MNQNDIDRFRLKSAPTACGCWEWTGATDKDGYGLFKLDGQCVRAHRIAYEIQHGPILDGIVMHYCDNPVCVNPAHLELGDQSNNVRDMVARGRAVGSPVGQKRLEPKTLDRIYALYRERPKGLTVKQIAERFGILERSVRRIVKRLDNGTGTR